MYFIINYNEYICKHFSLLILFVTLMIFVTLAKWKDNIPADDSDGSKHVGVLTIYKTLLIYVCVCKCVCIYIYMCVYIYIYIYIYIYVCVCVCVCVCVGLDNKHRKIFERNYSDLTPISEIKSGKRF